MDEVAGRLTSFNGETLTIRSREDLYVFDISRAALECPKGLLAGDELSVIYEGKLTGTDTSTVMALKVADTLHKKPHLKEFTVTGTLMGITVHSLSIQVSDSRIMLIPTIGKPMYFSSGITLGRQVTLHLMGDEHLFQSAAHLLPPPDNKAGSAPATPKTSGATVAEAAADPGTQGQSDTASQEVTTLQFPLVCVLSVSDLEPFAPPIEKPTPADSEEQPSAASEQVMRCEIQSFQDQAIRLQPPGAPVAVDLNLSSVPVYFPVGILSGCPVDIYYTGNYNGVNFDGLSILRITGLDPAIQRSADISCHVSGAIVGTTVNTLTIRTDTGTLFTCYTRNIQDSTTNDHATGSPVRIIFSPTQSINSNIFTVLKIQDDTSP